jgi:iron complex outermembrane recepter protein
MQKRDRLAYATLNQVSAEYSGKFMDERLMLNLGARLPFFKRDLNQNCYTTSASGNVDCIGTVAAANTAYQTANPYVVNAITGIPTGSALPGQRIYNYKKFLPNLGMRFKVTPDVSVFASFAKGLQVPGTDPLYNSMFFPSSNPKTKPAPETTDSYDLGFRVKSGGIESQVTAWLTQYQNRLASAYDADLDANVYRNLGNVKKWGFEASIGGQVTSMFEARIFGSVSNSRIKDNIAIGENTNGTAIYAATAGQREGGSAKFSFGGDFNFDMGPLAFNLNAKRTGPRNLFDTGSATYTGAFVPLGALTSTNGTPATPAAPTQIFGASAPAYWLLNVSARLKLEELNMGFNDKSNLQLNVYNLADQFYVGGFGGGLVQANTYSKTTGQSTYGAPGFVQIGAPRTVSLTATFGF